MEEMARCFHCHEKIEEQPPEKVRIEFNKGAAEVPLCKDCYGDPEKRKEITGNTYNLPSQSSK